MGLFEGFIAKRADIRPLPSMHPEVLRQVGFPSKLLLALRALQGVLRVDNAVDLEVGFVLKMLSAVRTLIHCARASTRGAEGGRRGM